MTKLLEEHGAHLGFVVIGIFAFLWVAYRPERDSGERVAGRIAVVPAEPAAPAPKARTVRRSVARRGLLALGPLIAAVATGAVLYGLDVGGGSVPGAVIWIHSGVSMLALLLVLYKVAGSGMARIRRAFTRDRLPELVSVILGILSVPLIVTGVGLLVAPSTSSFFAYSHLISSAWWTGLLVWHLRRYVGASLRAAFRSENRADLLLEGRDVSGEDVPRSVRVPG
ncbi:MAG TPA: hypothetical protein VMB27_15120 [Solirubrobacteraceae bacterium]|nr:hypothetical protein [Solirubrobacteraceae bacterium]